MKVYNILKIIKSYNVIINKLKIEMIKKLGILPRIINIFLIYTK